MSGRRKLKSAAFAYKKRLLLPMRRRKCALIKNSCVNGDVVSYIWLIAANCIMSFLIAAVRCFLQIISSVGRG